MSSFLTFLSTRLYTRVLMAYSQGVEASPGHHQTSARHCLHLIVIYTPDLKTQPRQQIFTNGLYNLV